MTAAELPLYFSEGVQTLANAEGTSIENAYELLKRNYDGYHFAPRNSVDVYNPFSLLNALEKSWIGDYWFRSGTPTFLVKLIRKNKLPLRRLDSLQTSVFALSDVSFDLSNYISVLYQSGYLTIKDYNRSTNLVTLGFPNLEVKRGFLEGLLSVYTSLAPEDSAFEIQQFLSDVQECRPDDFMRRLQSFFADFNYDAFEL